jgi:uncharacterized phage-like protein YoqJ
MTRKDYVLIADAIRQLLADIERESATAGCDRTRNIITGEHLGVRHAALRLADQLQQENPRFEMGTFLKACGIAA